MSGISSSRTGDHVTRIQELATKERARQAGGVVRDDQPLCTNLRINVARHRARCECKLDAYLHAGKIDADQHEAGMRYRMAYITHTEGVQLRTFWIVKYDSQTPYSACDKIKWSEQTIKEAHAALTPTQALIVSAVCGADEGVGSTARLKTLRRALERLARLWEGKEKYV